MRTVELKKMKLTNQHDLNLFRGRDASGDPLKLKETKSSN